MAIKQSTNPYYLDIKFGEIFGKTKPEPMRLDFSNHPIESLSVIQDVNRLCPSFRLQFLDASTEFSQLAPFDKSRNSVRIGFNRNYSPEDSTILDFDILRIFPNSDYIYDIEGILQVPNLFIPEKIRGFNTKKSVAEHLSDIALNELKVDAVEISPTLDKVFLNMVQPNWTNAEFLNFLKVNLQGSQEEAGYFCFIKQSSSKRVFVFKSLKELYKVKPTYYFKNQGEAFYDDKKSRVYYPILDFKVYDNYKILGMKGSRNQIYSHFDYNTSTFEQFNLSLTGNENKIDDFLSLTKYFCIDGNDTTSSFNYQNTGRQGTSSFGSKGSAKNMYYKRLNDLSKIWIVSMGIEDVQVGDVVSLEFLDMVAMVGSHQYNGLWLVERIIHSLGSTFGTRLLLTRSGIDTIEKTTLIPVEPKNIVKK